MKGGASNMAIFNATLQVKAPAGGYQAEVATGMHSLIHTKVKYTLHKLGARSRASRSVQGVFLAPDGISTAMQLFSRQTTQLCVAMRESSMYQAHLCSFFALLGAMPQCLKAEADAVMLMIRTARDATEHPAAEAQPGTGDLTAVFISSASLLRANWASSLMSCLMLM